MVAWLIVAIGLFITAPNMADLVREKGQLNVPTEYSSALAGDLLKEMRENEGTGDQSQVVVVFHNEKGLTQEDIADAESGIAILEDRRDKLGISEIMTHFSQEELRESLVSEDGKTIMAPITLDWNNREKADVTDDLYGALDSIEVEHYYTGEWMIDEDLVNSSQEGLKKTEGITVVFILIVLFLVFKSAIAPIIPLVTVGFTYIASQSIVSFLVDRFDFPISSYTQMFLVAILFGIGTDYCILLLSRFKEEMSHRESVTESIVETYRNAGRTVFFSGLAVLVGFSVIGFSQFKLFQSAVGVAVGVAMLLVALFTIVPFFMAVLGPKLFWPSKGSAEHGENKLWGLAGKFSMGRPLISLLVVAAICVPFLLTYDGDLSFNSLEEVSGDVKSVKAFNIIADSFGPGESMSTQIVLKNDEELDSAEYIQLAESISDEVKKVDLVKTVRSVTRPTGEPIEDFTVAKQTEMLGEGLGEGNDGINEISSGLQEASNQLANSQPELESATGGINELISGTNEVKTGVTQIQTNLARIEDGIRQGSAGSTEIKDGLQQLKAGAETLAAGQRELLAGYTEIQTTLATLNNEYSTVGTGLTELNKAISQITEEDFGNLENEYQGLPEDPIYQKVKGSVQAAQQQLPLLAGGLEELNAGLSSVTSGMGEANRSFNEIVSGQQELVTGLTEIISGIEKQQVGLEQLADGQGQINANLPSITNGLTGINAGQQQMLDGFGDLGGQLSELTEGLTLSADGLLQVHDGLTDAEVFLSELSNEADGFYLPDEVVKSEEFAKVLDTYMSADRKVMTMDVIFEANPYSNEAISQIDEIEDAISRATTETKLENAVVAIGGITSTNADLKAMSSKDYSRTVVLMLVGISIILVFLFRSIIMSLYLIGSLILTFYTAMAINEAIYVNLLGYTGISWAVPFFAFVILIALGVDYSIFLMDRFNEFKKVSVEEALLLAMRKMGTVILSAAVILGGTFAAMMPSGMLSLLQIASIVITGLALYAMIILPLFVPVMVKLFGQANWWPFKRV
nr:MMPL family transporter [Bacillus suaedae]